MSPSPFTHELGDDGDGTAGGGDGGWGSDGDGGGGHDVVMVVVAGSPKSQYCIAQHSSTPRTTPSLFSKTPPIHQLF